MNQYSRITEDFEEDKNRNRFKKYIEYIRFPYFKNFDENLRVDFDYPITFITGTNGTGKSSLLHALYGSVDGKSISDFWFNTVLESIEDLKENRHCFIYGFRTEITNTKVEAIKTRILKMKGTKQLVDADYWEPSRPIIRYGMEKVPSNASILEANKTRWKLLKRDVVYIDFRYSLSAFDKYFYFGINPDSVTMKSKQDLIRKRAHKIKEAYDTGKEQTFYTRIVSKPIELTTEALDEINKILGKNYCRTKILNHNLYNGQEGFSIKYVTDNINYTEAYAGSGEIAVVRLVNDIISLKDNSLILLDEPETSLHPDAQKKFVSFLLNQILKKKHQVVISTHSPDILEGAPEKAIKVFYESSREGKINVLQNVDYQSAFLHIGHTVVNKKVIIVEDKLAKEILQSIIDDFNYTDLFELIYKPGGESVIKKEDILVFSKNNVKNNFVILDGDQSFIKINPVDLPNREINSKDLNGLIKSLVKQDIEFCTDGGNGKGIKEKQEGQKTEAMLKYLDYLYKNVFFMPCNIPEEIIWDEETALTQAKEKQVEWGGAHDNYKIKIGKLSKIMFGSDEAAMISATHRYLITAWKNKADYRYSEIVQIIKQIINAE